MDWRDRVLDNPSTPTRQERMDELWKSMSIIGRNVFNLRNEKKLSIESLSIIADIQPYQIYKIEHEKYYNVTIHTLSLIARALGVTLGDLVSN